MAIASNLVRQNVRISQQAVTSPVFRIKGQRSRWFYPDQRLTPEHAERMRNIDISERGVAHSRYGYEPYTEKTLTKDSTSNYTGYSITGLNSVTYADGNNRRVILGSTVANPGAGTTKMWNDLGDGGTITELTGSTNLSAGHDVRFTTAFLKDKFFIADSYGQVQSWDGNLSNNFVTLAPKEATAGVGSDIFTACKGLFVHSNGLGVYGTTEGGVYKPTNIRFCNVSLNKSEMWEVDTNIFPQQNLFKCFEGGAPVVHCIDFNGKLLIFKEDGLYTGFVGTTTMGYRNFEFERTIRGFSPAGRNSIISRPEFCCGLAKEGIFVITPDLQYQIINSDDITEFFNLNMFRLDKAQAMIREADHQVRFYTSSNGDVLDPKVASSGTPLRGGGSAGFDVILVWDWETGDTWIDTPSHTVNTISSFVDTDGKQRDWIGALNQTEDGPAYDGNDSTRINGGNAFGRIYTGNQPSVNEDNGVPYNWQIKMSPNDLGMPGRSKHILNIRTLYRKRSGQQKLTFRANVNEGRESAYTEEVSLGTGVAWDQGESYNKGKKWPGTGALRADVFVNRVCETIAPEWFSNSPASIEGYIVEYIPLDS